MTQWQPPEPGDLFDARFRIDDILGSGGFAYVYRAEQLDLGRTVALKILRPFSAWSQSTETQHETQARHHFDEGARYFYEGNFSRAVVEFRRAYQYKPDPMILYNLSLAQSRLGNIRDAYDAGVAASTMPGMPDAADVDSVPPPSEGERVAWSVDTIEPFA